MHLNLMATQCLSRVILRLEDFARPELEASFAQAAGVAPKATSCAPGYGGCSVMLDLAGPAEEPSRRRGRATGRRGRKERGVRVSMRLPHSVAFAQELRGRRRHCWRR